MNADIAQLAAEVAEATGAKLPGVMEDDSPALRAAELPSNGGEGFYLVGLIGGKEVGKSALVNALVGERITASTAYGPGTETVVAYVHESQVQQVTALLEREASGKFKIVPHGVQRLRRQVLLDLPDIDSVYGEHVELTRKMLRHMLFPIWVQSIEKYADQQPQKLLAAVAEGNDAFNFLYCLNKCDQVSEDAAQELKLDYAQRLTRVIGRGALQNVYLVSAIRPEAFELPLLREKLSQEKSSAAVKHSLALAGKQHERSIVAWLDSQRLGERAARMNRLEQEAADVATSRLAQPLLENAVPRILGDPAHRAAIIDEVMGERVARWPIVNILHTLMLPITSIWRQNVGAGPTPEALVSAMVDQTDGRSLPAAIRATFALLQQTQPAVGVLYRQQKLWDALPAEAATARLKQSLAGAIERHRAEAISRLSKRGFVMPLVRWTLTIGAVIWFPIVQPVLELFLKDSLAQTAQGMMLLAVQLFSAAYLLKSAAFLAIWFLALWLILRWDTQRRVNKLLARWRRADGADASINLAAVVMTWADELLDPIHRAREHEESLARRADEVRQHLSAPAA